MSVPLHAVESLDRIRKARSGSLDQRQQCIEVGRSRRPSVQGAKPGAVRGKDARETLCDSVELDVQARGQRRTHAGLFTLRDGEVDREIPDRRRKRTELRRHEAARRARST